MAQENGSARKDGGLRDEGLSYEPSIAAPVTKTADRCLPCPRNLSVYVSFDSNQWPRIASGFVVMRLQKILPSHRELNLVSNLPTKASVGSGVCRDRFLSQSADEAITQVEVEHFRKIVAGLCTDLVART